ncbi:MAG: anaerobic glycerol-3-phosphate dehydrogenase subunit B [Anaerolineales bacterium]
MKQLVVVGAGLAGLYASCLAARRGSDVTLLTSGRGGLGLSSGRIEVWSRGPPDRAPSEAPRGHPYRRVSASDLRAAVDEFRDMMTEQGLPYEQRPGANLLLPTALGALRAAALTPGSQSLSRIPPEAQLGVAGVEGFRDFSAPLAAAGKLGRRPVRVIPDLPPPSPPGHRDLYSTDLATQFDSREDLEEVAQRWSVALRGVEALLMPAVLGWRHHAKVHHTLEQHLGIPIVEIPTLPPSVPGLRLERALHLAAFAAGVDYVEGSRAVGRVAGRSRGRRADAVAAFTPGGMRVYPAQAVILATGGALHGGWRLNSEGEGRESVFGLPLAHQADGGEWTAPQMASPQPYSYFGLRVDRDLRPLAADGTPAFENVFAAGGILAGADRTRDGSRQGIDLATAYRAVRAALE